MLVQIYEVQTAEEALLALVGVDHIGVLVGDGMFPRELPVDRANAIFAAVPPVTKRVALSLSSDPQRLHGWSRNAAGHHPHRGAGRDVLGP